MRSFVPLDIYRWIGSKLDPDICLPNFHLVPNVLDAQHRGGARLARRSITPSQDASVGEPFLTS
jgi:hypothetical protein